MTSPAVIQHSFNSGEWAPDLAGRTDVEHYHASASLLENWFVDYKGGARTSPGTKFIIQAKDSTSITRLIPFQASTLVSYVLVFGNQTLSFLNNGAPVLEAGIAITAITLGNPVSIFAVNTYTNGDTVFISGIVGTTQLNGSYFKITNRNAAGFNLTDMNGTNINATAYTAWISGGSVQRVYTIASPYLASELAALKYVQNVNVMILNHPNYGPYQLVLTSATSWALTLITFGSTIAAPTGQAVATTLGAGTYNYAYVITAVDANGQESVPSAFAVLAATLDQRAVAGTNSVTWTAVTGASSYNVYRADPRQTNPVPAGSAFGFVGNVTGLILYDSNIVADFAQGPPIAKNPFFGSGVQSITLTANANYTVVPTLTLTAPPPGGIQATAAAFMQLASATVSPGNGGSGFAVTNTFQIANAYYVVTGVTGPGSISTLAVSTPGSWNGVLPASDTVGSPTGGAAAHVAFVWNIGTLQITQAGTGYAVAPAVTFSSGAATATTALGAPSAGNPTVPCFINQRFGELGPVSNPQQFDFSQPGSYYNFNTTFPIAPDNAIEGSLVSGILNTINAAVPMPQGLVVLSDRQAWLMNGGSPGLAISAVQTVANSQIYNGCAANPQPIVAGDHILYVQAKNSIIRDLAFQWQTQVYTGADISILSSHLFTNFQITEWAWAEEPYKLVYAVRSDGTMLNLTYLKEQELIAWTHRTTLGTFQSVCTVTESTSAGIVDAIYVVAQRAVNGFNVRYIERVTDIFYPNGLTDVWQVDSALQYNGAATLSFQGAQNIAGLTATGLATDNTNVVSVITPFVVGLTQNGAFTLPAPAAPATGYTRVTLGLAYLPVIQTQQIDTGEPTIQGKRKKMSGVTLKVKDALGLEMGTDLTTQQPIRDLVIGNVGSASNEIVTGLTTGNVRGILDPDWQVAGQFYITQPLPYPATVLAVIPELSVGDTAK